MDAATAGLIGSLGGVALGGLLQGGIQSARERRQRSRDERAARQAAYANYLSAAHALQRTSTLSSPLLRKLDSVHGVAQVDAQAAATQRHVDRDVALAHLRVASTEAWLVSRPSVQQVLDQLLIRLIAASNEEARSGQDQAQVKWPDWTPIHELLREAVAG